MKVCLRCKHTFSFDEWTCPSCGHQPERMNGILAHAPESAYAGTGFKPEYFSELYQLETDNFWFRARNELIHWALRTYKSDASTFLEVGCGTGFVLSGIAAVSPQLELSGSEIFIDGLSHSARRVPTAHLMQMDGRSVPFIDEFDAIGAFDVLEHIAEDELVLAQIYRAIKPGGVLLLTVPQHAWLWSASDEYACHVRRYKGMEIEKKVLRAGFDLLRSTSFVTSLLPVMILSRLSKKKKTEDFDPAGELRINAVLNKVFYGLMKLDIVGIKIGMNFSLGGSRLIVAKKPDCD